MTTLVVCLILPVLAMLVFAVKHKRQGVVSAWLLGAAGFVITQIVVRLPILTALSAKSWFVSFAQSHLFLYAFLLAFTAGLFELAGRFAVAKLLQRKMTWNRALAAGLGHGGIEAMRITGMTYVNNLVYIVIINSGTLFAVVAPDAPPELAAQMEAIQAALMATPPGMFLLAGVERLLAMTGHAAMSVIVCRGVFTGHAGKATLACLGIHTLLDLTAGISLLIGTTLMQATAYAIIYGILTLAAALSVWMLWRIRRSWQAAEPERPESAAEPVWEE